MGAVQDGGYDVNEEKRKSIIKGLDSVARELEHWAFLEQPQNKGMYEDLRAMVLDGVKLIYEQENIIKALLGEYGDACDVEEGC